MEKEIQIKIISYSQAIQIINKYHYSKVMPRLTKFCLGAFVGDDLIGVTTWGYGVRPLHTIKKLFPSLGVKNYLELGKFCVSDEMPKNTESQILSLVIKWFVMQPYLSSVKLLFTWADGMLNKPGYVYQSANFLYGGYIWTDTYFSNTGEKIHPRTTGKIGGRPNQSLQEKLGWQHYFGKQFRYIYFLCNKGEQKKLLKESSFKWLRVYPKQKDCEWKKNAGKGSRESCVAPSYTGSVRFRSPAPLFDK